MTIHQTSRRAEPATIRDLRREDVDAVVALDRRCFDESWPRSAFVAAVNEPATWAWVAVVEGEIAANLVAHVRHRTTIHLANLAVAPHWRRRGLGRALLRRLERRANRFYAHEIRLEVHVGNLAARSLYLRAGYVVGDRVREYYGDADAFLMRRTLRAPGPYRERSLRTCIAKRDPGTFDLLSGVNAESSRG